MVVTWPSCVLQDDAPTPYDVLVGSLPQNWEDVKEEIKEADSCPDKMVGGCR